MVWLEQSTDILSWYFECAKGKGSNLVVSDGSYKINTGQVCYCINMVEKLNQNHRNCDFYTSNPPIKIFDKTDHQILAFDAAHYFWSIEFDLK